MEIWHANLVKWRSRRGLLELDLIFIPFYEFCYHNLNDGQKQLHQWFLIQNDTDLQSWFLFRKNLDQLTFHQCKWIDVVKFRVLDESI